MYDEIKNKISQVYDNNVDERSKRHIQDWKLADRAQFLAKLGRNQQTHLLEIGADSSIWASTVAMILLAFGKMPAMNRSAFFVPHR